MRISDWSSDVCSSDLSGGLPVARLLVATSVGPPVHAGEAVGRVDVQHERHDDARAEEPAAPGAGEEGHEQLAEELAVVVERLGTEVHIQVAEGVEEHEAPDHEPGDRHHLLLADSGAAEPHRPGPPSLGSVCNGRNGRASGRAQEYN